MRKRRAKRKARKAKRKKKEPVRGRTTRRAATQFDEHVRMMRRIAKKLGKKVARLTGRSRRPRQK
jgi:hypothetical protein